MGGLTIWKHSWRDVFPFGVTVVQGALSVWLAWTWEERTIAQLLALWPVCVLLFWYNPIISTHNFLHTPWFRGDRLNRLYAALNSVNLGVPQILYRFHHLNHHRYENDRRAPDGTTLDLTSTFAHGTNGLHENVIPYSALGLLRPSSSAAYATLVRKGEAPQFWLELGFCVAGLAGLGLLSWRWLVFFYPPTFFFGWFLAHMENYYEHYGAIPEKRSANSVSYYGALYNALFCNEGYHQEHHLRPQAHWLQRPRVHQEMRDRLADPDRVISRFPPLLGFLDRRPDDRGSMHRLADNADKH